MMTEIEFRRLAEAFGADVSRWPDSVRAEAEALAGEAWAVAILHEAAAIDDMLTPSPTTIPAGIADRAIAGVSARIASERSSSDRFAWLRLLAGPLSGMAAAGLIGGMLGLSGMASPSGGEESLFGLLAATVSFSDPFMFVTGG